MIEAASLLVVQNWPSYSRIADINKRKLNKFYILFQGFYCRWRFLQTSKHLLCIDSILSQISSRVYNATNQAIAMDSNQSYFRKLYVFFSGKQQCVIRTDWKSHYLLMHHFCTVLSMLKVATPLSVVSATRLFWHNRENKWKVTKNFDST